MLQGKHVTKLYKVEDLIIHILINAHFTVSKGEFIFLAGFSGTGKTTFLKILSAEEMPDHGEILFNNITLTNLNEQSKLKYRQSIGVIYQDYHLIEYKTVEENIKFVLEALGKKEQVATEITHTVLDTVGLYKKRMLYPEQLSGGEKRRITIARALAVDPIMILADEPTGDLDPYNTEIIMNILHEISKAGTSIIMATHNMQIVENFEASQYWLLHNGELHISKSPYDIQKLYTDAHQTKKTVKIINNIPATLKRKIVNIHPALLANIKHMTPRIFHEYYGLTYKELKILINSIR